jgi:hypothetical protein
VSVAERERGWVGKWVWFRLGDTDRNYGEIMECQSETIRKFGFESRKYCDIYVSEIKNIQSWQYKGTVDSRQST